MKQTFFCFFTFSAFKLFGIFSRLVTCLSQSFICFPSDFLFKGNVLLRPWMFWPMCSERSCFLISCLSLKVCSFIPTGSSKSLASSSSGPLLKVSPALDQLFKCVLWDLALHMSHSQCGMFYWVKVFRE